jgi:hypothetical protein
VPGTQPAPVAPAAAPQAPSGGGINDKRDRIAEITADFVMKTHGAANWRSRTALQADISMTIGQQSLDGRLVFSINEPGIRLELKDGTILGSDGKTVWLQPASSPLSIDEARRILHSCKLIVAGPLLLREPGSKQVFYRSMHFMGQASDTFKLSLSPSLAGASLRGEWSMAYAGERSHRLEALAHIALPLEADQDAEAPTNASHAVVYVDTQDVDQVTLPAKWDFYSWTEAAGVRRQPVGSGAASNVQFARPDAALFRPPLEARTQDPNATTRPE